MIPSQITDYEKSSRFWTDYTSVTDVKMEERSSGDYYTKYGETSCAHQIEWDLAVGFKLHLELRSHLDAEISLVTPDGVQLTLGWDDQSHWHPHVLRRVELEKLCRVIAFCNPDDPHAAHPGWPIRLLDRFAPVCDGDDIPNVYASLFSAHRQFSQLDDEIIVQTLQTSDCRGSAFAWEEDPDLGWLISQDDSTRNQRRLYSLRSRPKTISPEQQMAMEQLRKRGLAGPEIHFPYQELRACLKKVDTALNGLRRIGDQSDDAKMFAESGDEDAWRLFCQSIREAGFPELAVTASSDVAVACWVAEEALGLPTWTLARQMTGSINVATRRVLSIHYGDPHEPTDGESPLFAKLFLFGFDAVLRDRVLGSMRPMSSGQRTLPDGREVSTGDSDSISTTLDEDALANLVRQWFVYGGGPILGSDDRPRPMLTRQSFSDPLPHNLHERPVGPLHLNLTKLETIEHKHGWRIGRVELDDDARSTIAEKLRTVGFEVAYRAIVNDGDGLTISTSSIDESTSQVLWDVMEQWQLMLLPHVISTPAARGQITRHREYVKVVENPSELAVALQRQ